MTEKRFTKQEVFDGINRYRVNESNFIVEILDDGIPMHYSIIVNRLNEQHKTITRLEKENEQLKKGMIGVVDRYIKNVECNPPSSARTYGKIKGALINIREDLRSLIGDFE